MKIIYLNIKLKIKKIFFSLINNWNAPNFLDWECIWIEINFIHKIILKTIIHLYKNQNDSVNFIRKIKYNRMNRRTKFQHFC